MSWGAAARGLQATTQLVSGANAWTEFFNHFSSVISSACSRFINIQQRPDKSDEHQMQEDTLRLQSNLWQLQTTLPKMHELIERLEWQSHKKAAAELLPHIKDIVCDAEDLLDEFHYYELKVKVEQRVDECQTLPAFQDFFSSVIQGGFNEVKQIQDELDHLYGQSRDMGLHNAPQRFDKEVRPETSSFPNVSNIFGREEEVHKVIKLLGVLPNSNVGFKRKRGNSVDVLSIVGLGGVGKTTLAQQVCNSRRIKAHFDMTLWTCVSDEFDVKRLTKEVIESSRNKASVDNLDSLQAVLTDIVRSKRFLLVLDDIWDDVLKDDGEEWRRFCAPLSNALQGSMILVTTRSQIVADKVRTMDSFPLEGLKDEVFWEFFKLQAFGSQSANNHPELEDIGRSIAEKLKGSPLAAKTVGRLLSRNLHTTHWNNILYSELWKLEQQKTDILPALRLSYMYLPPHLKRCFSFCAVYPKDHGFRKGILADIWVAEGFVQHQNGIPITTVSCQYFEDLLSRSFFQKSVSSDKYVIHDLMHDMAQLVSGDECFIIRDSNDLQNIPRNVRHLSIFAKRNIDCHDLMGLCKYKKLHTLVCNKTFGPKAFAPVVGIWFKELRRIRVLISTFSRQCEIPESIGNLKHLRYLYLTGACTLKSAPSSLNCLYNLEILDASKCEFESLPIGFSNIINLRKFKSKNFKYAPEEIQCLQFVGGQRFISALKHKIQIDVNLHINIYYHFLGNENVARVELEKKNDLNIVRASLFGQHTSGQELAPILEILDPHSNIKELQFNGYAGDFWPSWFQPVNLPNLKSLKFEACHNIPGITFSTLPCTGFQFLEALEILNCPSISWQKGFVLPSSLRRLSLVYCGDVSEWVPACLVNLTSLVHLQLIGLFGIISIPGDIWRNSLQFLDYLQISDCDGLLSIGEPEVIAQINNVDIDKCPMLNGLEQPLRR